MLYILFILIIAPKIITSRTSTTTIAAADASNTNLGSTLLKNIFCNLLQLLQPLLFLEALI